MSTSTMKTLLKDATPDLRKIGRALPKLMKHPKMQKVFFKLMTKIWSEDEESRRVLAFLNILKAVDVAPDCVPLCIKTMFVAYVRNCKFVFGATIAQITFMRLSLLELFSKNVDEAYLHAFAYIRQLAICLRKAHTSHSKDDLQAVQNWQFISSLQLWAEFVAAYHSSHKLVRTLIHPLVQLLIGTVRLSPGERWVPLRFHCVSMLHTLAGVPRLRHTDEDKTETGLLPLTGNALSPANRLLVPSLPLLLDTFRFVNFNRRATGVSPAPLDLRLLLHFSPSQRRETASMDAVVSWLFDLLAEAAAIQANSLAFPEFVLPLLNELKQFSHTCRVASFTRQMKSLQTKLREHSDWISTRRRRLRNLANPEELTNLEAALCVLDGSTATSPFWTFYVCHKEVRAQELARLTESHKKDPIPDESAQPKRKFQKDIRAGDSDEDSDSVESDESYDVDDGTSITHVSKSKKSSTSAMDIDQEDSAMANGDSEDSDFDLEAVLKEPEVKSDSEAEPDEVTDFELSDSEDERDEESASEGTDEEARSPITLSTKKKSPPKATLSSSGKPKQKNRHIVRSPAVKVHKNAKSEHKKNRKAKLKKK